MIRRTHNLKAAKTVRFPKHMIFLDTETTIPQGKFDIFRPTLIVGVAKYIELDNGMNVINSDTVVFRSIEVFKNWFISLQPVREEIIIYAHNWNFDYTVIDGSGIFQSLGYDLVNVIIAPIPFALVYRKQSSRITLIDTLNYFKLSLEEIGRYLGFKKLTDIKLGVYSEDLLRYCIRDVEIIEKAVLSLIRYLVTNDLAGLGYTTSGIAFNTYIRRFMPIKIMIHEEDNKIDPGRLSYFGGRNECMRIGVFKGKIRLLDINSQYPYVMRENSFPIRVRHIRYPKYPNELEALIKKHTITAKVDLNTDIPAYPVKLNDRTCFPIGSFTSYLSTPELLYALEHDHIRKVHFMLVYDSGKIFRDYVDYFYAQRVKFRTEGNEMYQLFSKLMMNSLYGKFGQTYKDWKKTYLTPKGFPRADFMFSVTKNKRVYFMELNNVVYISETKSESRDSFPAIAAHVTAYARILMQRTLDKVGRDNVYYMDTDSIIVNNKGYMKIKDDTDQLQLGRWSVEAETNKIEIRGCKDYSFGDIVKVKGISKRAHKIDAHTYRQLQFGSLKAAIKSGDITSPILRMVTKRLKRDYKKGHVLPSGVVEPFTLLDGIIT